MIDNYNNKKKNLSTKNKKFKNTMRRKKLL